SRELGVPRCVLWYEQLWNDFGVSEQHQVGHAMKLGDLANVLERRAALTLDDRAGARGVCIEQRLHRLAEAGSEVEDERVGENVKHSPKKASARVARYSRNFVQAVPSCPSLTCAVRNLS